MTETGAAINIDRLLWREAGIMPGDSPSIHVTQDGCIGINVGGLVIVKPVREWHALAAANVIKIGKMD